MLVLEPGKMKSLIFWAQKREKKMLNCLDLEGKVYLYEPIEKICLFETLVVVVVVVVITSSEPET